MMAAKRYSFPVVTGVTAQQSAEERASRMRIYGEFMSASSSAGNPEVSQLSEVDLSDPEDVRILLPSAGSDLLVHFGSEDFAARWQRLEEKLPGWRQQYPLLAGVDLRYQRQTVLEMAKPVEEASAAAAASTRAPAKLGSKTVGTPVTHSHSANQTGKIATRSRSSQKTSTSRKPAHTSAIRRDTKA
jgi:cell division protein FtsQ